MRARRVIGLALGMLVAAAPLFAAGASTTVLLVRHAEKTSAATDPPLSVAGKARARVLAHVAGSAGVNAIYHTQFQRTQQTVKPLAVAQGLTPIQHRPTTRRGW